MPGLGPEKSLLRVKERGEAAQTVPVSQELGQVLVGGGMEVLTVPGLVVALPPGTLVGVETNLHAEVDAQVTSPYYLN